MPRFTRILLSAALAVTVSGGVVATQADAVTPRTSTLQAASKEKQLGYWLDAGPRLKAKYGHSKRFFGPIYNKGILGDCIDYGKADPNGDWSTGAFGYVKGDKLRAQISLIESKYWTAGLTSSRYAAARNSTVNRLKDPKDFEYDWDHKYVAEFTRIDKGVIALSDRMLAEAKAYAGPVKVVAAFTTAPAKKGATGVVQVKVTANGRPYPGQAIRWTVTGGKVTAAGKTTSKNGTAVLKLTQTGNAPVTVTPVVVTPDWRRAKFSTPTSGRKQHLVRGVGPVTTRATVSHYTATVAQDCGDGCDGRPPMTLTATAGTKAVQWRVISGTKVIGTLSLKAGKTGTAKFTGTDGQHLLIQYRVKGGKWRTAQIFDVICPAWPKVVIGCACDGALTVTLTPTGSRYYTASVGTKTVDLAGPTTVKTVLKAGSAATISVTAYQDAAHLKPIGSHTYGTWTQG